MDHLALLCNLHADGPETLQRLRANGCDTLREVEAVDVMELDGVLGVGQVRAMRFQREARQLRQRLGDVTPEDEPPRPPRGAAPARRAATEDPPAERSSGRRVVEPEAEAARAPQVSTSPSRLPSLRLDLSAGVLQPRSIPPMRPPRPERDAPEPEPESAAPEAPPEPPTAKPATAEPPLAKPPAPEPRVYARVVGQLETTARQPAVQTSADGVHVERRPTSLARAGIDGLDGELARALETAGVRSAAELAAADALELAEAAGVDYTRLRRVQFLAKRAAASGETIPLGVLEAPAPRRAAVRTPVRSIQPTPPREERAGPDADEPSSSAPGGSPPLRTAWAAPGVDPDEASGNVAGPFA